MRHKILLPTDFSKNSIKAINCARALFKNEHCNFYIMNVFSAVGTILENLLNMQPGNEFYQTAKLNSEKGLAKVLDIITLSNKPNPKHHFEIISEFNDITEAVKHIVDKKDIEMIVMGTKGKTQSRQTAFGSNAINIMEKVHNCPVLVVPEATKINSLKEVVFPTDYKIPFKRRELIHLINIVKKTNANIAILHVDQGKLTQQQVDNKNLLKEIFKGINYNFHNLSNNSIQAAINNFVESRSSNMVAFINKKHAFFGSIFSNPLVKEITFHLKVPILALHDLSN
ncbi:universal stress protein [Winogradskyella endarachnes]|uniref:Universal stress protein n=1 Tax=Winogradskyella endarachnes TaxID=2681965 RepID=A0A6L6UFF0_9FLAO|nr:universal stress protein [Winogradskyella endarachnes]MUU79692.1 universal stress protein [Winogradskyella endarachnes]